MLIVTESDVGIFTPSMLFTIVLFAVILLITLGFAFIKEKDSIISNLKQRLGWGDPTNEESNDRDDSDVPEDQSTRSEQSVRSGSKAENSKELFNDLLLPEEKELDSAYDKSDDESEIDDDSDAEVTPAVIDYDSYSRVCEEYRKTSAALKDREAEVAELMKDNEAKGLTIKLLRDQLQSYGSIVNPSKDTPEDTKQLQTIIDQQKQVIQSLLGADGTKTDIEKLLKMYEEKVKELSVAHTTIEQYKAEFSQIEMYKRKAELVDKLLIENETLQSRLRMEFQFPAYSFPANFQYPLMPPGFGYSQNTSVADGNSIGVMNDEELSEEGDAPLPAERPSTHSVTPSVNSATSSVRSSTFSKSSKRPFKLKNKVYFQLLDVTNAMQQSQAKKEGGGDVIKLSSQLVMKLAVHVLETQIDDPASMTECKKQLAMFIPLVEKCSSGEFSQYVSQLRAVLDKTFFSGSNV